ncbi:type I-E CRISPR-associated protein Cas6/Cse3/CasE [Corynebacterium anserum]|uniref:Type I-E CRISPR-associated protein Cas6/Cse3/CasE n=1 Tax=Corynebacterium anserum TaxID=2684406 RepID=A0A7G7YLS0_9CORY|nr:type I-E CRISPR-associated protein Cas6/Cse3/CasE [Corynebacterium anserum]MBC2681396.1 type I-E CRISPR-associated protein Cas6/Cse3/CasE [Corynebacterium anserum]QNH95440.1 type I-E CRISPR-associated protein Cas6/Cse3/CasE [Corynebacterium anserum]
MTTFTKVLINPARRQGRTYLINPNALHAAVRYCFPADIDQTQQRILWRLDNRDHEHVLYIVGPEKPTTAHIVDEAGWETRPQQTADYDRMLSQLTLGQRWHFELLANPTKTLNQGRDKRGKVVAHLSAHEQLKWLHRKAESMGVSFGSVEESTARVIESKKLSFRKLRQDGKQGHSVHLITARYAGTLEVVDVDKLRETLTNGVGRAKGYGCGLLTLARGEE